MTSVAITPESFFLFGGSRPWLPPPWHTSDDRVRGGSSRSSLSALPDNCARFDGHLDIETLGGAGFASQFQSAASEQDDGATASDAVWDLSAYSGLEIDVASGDGKGYTFILKDEKPQDKRDDGRGRAGINWEAGFRLNRNGEDGDGRQEVGCRVWVPWTALKATYRGKEKEDAGKLKTGEIRQLGFMMRSHFGTQQGDFKLQLRSISARKQPSETAELVQG
ncbi:MAG: hypothetical protein LQ338_003213 [Usnochroma carphineum]|nr:MAG: hypothetical protein LQ338_003213 [Usnochroma carphineum]